MSDQKMPSKPVMIAVGLVLILIIVGAVFMLRGKVDKALAPSADQSAPVTQSPAPVETRTDIPPGPDPVYLTGDPVTAPPGESIRPTEIDTATPEGGEVLQLDNIAGTLRMSVSGMEGEGRRYPVAYTCYGDNASPGIEWHSAPEGTKSFVVMLELREQDKAPVLQWSLFNIPGDAQKIEPGLPRELPAGGMRYGLGLNDATSYVGPCQSFGLFPYAVRLFALDSMLDIPAGASRDELVRAMNGHILDARNYYVNHYRRY